MTYDISLVLFLAAIAFTFFAQKSVRTNFKIYSRVRNACRITGAEAARKVLDANGLGSVRIEHIKGSLTDHYDPRDGVLRLSDGVYAVDSVAAVSVACHEAGHALQHAEGYGPLKTRNTIVPVVNFASRSCWLLIFLGLAMTAMESYLGDVLFTVGVLMFVAVIIFHAVTLPVEFNASERALKQMEATGVIRPAEEEGAEKVLRAAAMTYVASLAVAVANLARVLAVRGRND